MTEWVLIIAVTFGSNGVAITQIEHLTKEGCLEQVEIINNSKWPASAICIEHR